jgi:hypothetical protein
MQTSLLLFFWGGLLFNTEYGGQHFLLNFGGLLQDCSIIRLEREYEPRPQNVVKKKHKKVLYDLKFS